MSETKDIQKEVFEKNLKTKSEKDMKDFCDELANSIHNICNKYGVQNRTISFKYSEQWSSYGGNYKYASFDENSKKQMEEFFSQRSINQFQEALQNFAWAVNNQQ